MQFLQKIFKFFRRFITSIVSLLTDFVFIGSKSIITPKRRPIVTSVERLEISEYNIRGFIYAPREDTNKSTRRKFSCFPDGLRSVIEGKLQYYQNYDDRSLVQNFFMNVFTWMCACIPSGILPKVRNCFEFDQQEEVTQDLPLILWSHGRGGNTHDHAWLCSELASQVPAIVVSVTHTDGTADFFKRIQRGRTALYQHLKASVRDDEKYLVQLVEMREYQIKYRIEELERAAEYVRGLPHYRVSDKVLMGGFELGGATAVAAAANGTMNVAGVISLDGLFSIEDRFRFPREMFEGKHLSCPAAFVLSDEWSVWNKPVTENTENLYQTTKEKTGESTRLITLKQTNHLNLTECMYWVPHLLVSGLRLSGIVHRRGNPRKVYRRMTKWLVSVAQQYLNGSTDTRGSPEL